MPQLEVALKCLNPFSVASGVAKMRAHHTTDDAVYPTSNKLRLFNCVQPLMYNNENILHYIIKVIAAYPKVAGHRPNKAEVTLVDIGEGQFQVLGLSTSPS